MRTSSPRFGSGLMRSPGWILATKAEAKAKLDNLYVGVGYPDSWRDYSAYEVKADDIFDNLWRGGLFDYHRDSRPSGPSGQSQRMVHAPQTVDAVNCRCKTRCIFPPHISNRRTSTRRLPLR